MKKQKTAFFSVFNKNGIEVRAKELIDLGFDIMSSTGTAKYLKEKGIPVQDLAELVGEPIFGHRVVTLSREFYAMLLSRLDNAEDMAELARLGLSPIDLVCCDVYPLEEEIAREGGTLESVIEKTDIGGPTMIRAAAKGGRVVVCDQNDWDIVIEWFKKGEPHTEDFKRAMAAKAEFVVAKYGMASAEYLSRGVYKGIFGELVDECAYGENKYQTPARVYQTHTGPYSPNAFELLTETPLSYNNFCDRDRTMLTFTKFAEARDTNSKGHLPYTAIAVKHGNPCGMAIGETPLTALQKMIEGDTQAIHGASIITNFTIGVDEAETIIHYLMNEEARRLIDTVTAPKCTEEAVNILSRKKGKCRIVVNENLFNMRHGSVDTNERIRHIRDGFIVQPNYSFVLDFENADMEVRQSPGGKEVSDQEKDDLLLAWAIGSTSNSNTITITKEGKLLGNGTGQQDRVGAANLAIKRADDAYRIRMGNEKAKQFTLEGAVAYSDSFFPFDDAPLTLGRSGIKTILTSRGSVHDEVVFTSCNEQGITFLTVPDDKARGFAWH